MLPAIAVWHVGFADRPDRDAVLSSLPVQAPTFAWTFDTERLLANASPSGSQDASPLRTSSDASPTPLPAAKGATLPPLSAHNGTLALLPAPIDALARDTPDLRLVLFAYLAVLAVAAALVFSVVRRLRQFDRIATELAYGRAIDCPSTAPISVRELTGAMTALDRLVLDLRRTAERTRQAAEDSAHAMRTPLGTIMGSLDAIRRGLPPDNKRAWRAVEFIDASANRLAALISEARCRQIENADQVAAPRLRVHLSELAAQATRQLREAAVARNIRLVERLEDGIFVRAPREVLEILVDEMLDEACLARPATHTVIVSLTADRETIRLEIDVERAGDVEKGGEEESADAATVPGVAEALGGRVVMCAHPGSLAIELPRG
jgi:signal transduction histidine kinase